MTSPHGATRAGLLPCATGLIDEVVARSAPAAGSDAKAKKARRASRTPSGPLQQVFDVCLARPAARSLESEELVRSGVMLLPFVAKLCTPGHSLALGNRQLSPLAMLPADRQLSVDHSALLRTEPAMAVGATMLLVLLANRLMTASLFNSQSRADLLAVVVPVLIILKALGDLDITPREDEPVQLGGQPVAWLEPSLPAAARSDLEWAAEALLVGSCAAVSLWRGQRTLLLRGTLPFASEPERAVVAGSLLQSCAARNSGAPEYLPALQLLPGRVEFGYLPENTQGVLILPLVSDSLGVVVLAADRQRGFAEGDVEWALLVASRLSDALRGTRTCG